LTAFTSKAPADPANGVLVVDDNFGVAKALSAVLRQAGFNATACHCGKEALTFCDGATPAAAVIDIHLPDINGLILAQKMRDRYGPQMPIIIVSGDTSMETIKSLSHVGATYFFSKPINANILVARLKELLAPDAERAAS
jgi:DNA-binding response OmpR family regulator